MWRAAYVTKGFIPTYGVDPEPYELASGLPSMPTRLLWMRCGRWWTLSPVRPWPWV